MENDLFICHWHYCPYFLLLHYFANILAIFERHVTVHVARLRLIEWGPRKTRDYTLLQLNKGKSRHG